MTKRSEQTRARHAAKYELRKKQREGPLTPWRAWFDGAAHPNPGQCSIGGLVQGPEGAEWSISRPAGYGNSSEAEYRALIAVLEVAVAAGAGELTIYGDSQGVIDDERARVGAPSLSILREQARTLISQLPNVKLRWVPRHKNAHADALSQQAARKGAVMG